MATDTTALEISLHHVPGDVEMVIVLQRVLHPLPQHHLLADILVQGEHGDGAYHFTDDAQDHQAEERHHHDVVRPQ